MQAQSSVSPDLFFSCPDGVRAGLPRFSILVPQHLDGKACAYLARSILVRSILIRSICCRSVRANVHLVISSLTQLRCPVHSVNRMLVLVVACRLCPCTAQ